MNSFVVVVAVVSGLVIGSFLTVVVERVPCGESVVAPRSRCASCTTPLGIADLVPVGSWIAAGGRCRHCGASIGAPPLAIELATATLFAMLALRHGATWQTAAFGVLAAALVALSAIDLVHRRLPREISYTALVLSTPLLALAAVHAGDPRRMVDMGVAVVGATAVMGALHLLSRRGLGDGDVRLTPLLAAHLGWFGADAVVTGLLTGFVLGAVVGVAGMLTGRLGRHSELPFGPFLAVGALSTVLFA